METRQLLNDEEFDQTWLLLGRDTMTEHAR